VIQSLIVKNFALIDDLTMDFLPGLSAMTGETGAGKSIILESLQLLFGKRSDAQMIRHGEKKAIVRGVFSLNHDQQERLNLPDLIDIEREIDQSGRHNMRLNGDPITLQKIKDIMSSIGSIHSQNETMNLYDKSYYLELIDQMDSHVIDPLKNSYLILRSTFLTKKKHHEDLKLRKNQSLEKKSFLEYQVEELKNFHLKENEKSILDEQIEKLKNYDRIMGSLKDAYQSLDHDGFEIDEIYHAHQALKKVAHLDHTYEQMSSRLEAAYYDIDDVKSSLFQTIESLDFDEDAFNRMQERSYELIKIEQKYQKTIDDLIIYLKEIEEELLLITDYDHYLAESKKDLDLAFDKAYDLGIKLSLARKKLSKTLEKNVLSELAELDLDKATFQIEFDPFEKKEESLSENGLDTVEFNISLNEGEPVKPLARVASGGERARFMFALKSIYATMNHLSLLILDEIDIGISGKTASKVATKMKGLSQTIQLIVITHLPQVAARADHHYGITKVKEKERMVTRIEHLNEDERIERIALMLSDEKLSHFAIEQAKMLLRK
jgi:DNA repair protein RecN (Recombination protein N)